MAVMFMDRIPFLSPNQQRQSIEETSNQYASNSNAASSKDEHPPTLQGGMAWHSLPFNRGRPVKQKSEDIIESAAAAAVAI